MKWTIPFLLFSFAAMADEMRVIGDFRVPNSAFGRIYWIELTSDTDGKMQCAVRVDKNSGGLTCDWPKKIEKDTKEEK